MHDRLVRWLQGLVAMLLPLLVLGALALVTWAAVELSERLGLLSDGQPAEYGPDDGSPDHQCNGC